MCAMRVTQAMMVERSISSLQTSQSRLAAVQEQLSTGRILNRPSDSPTDTVTAMRLRSTKSEAKQYARNAQDGLGRMGIVQDTLTNISGQISRANELALSGASGGSGPTAARNALAAEIDQIRMSLVNEGNADYAGRPVFGGITSGSIAFQDDGTYVGVDGPIVRTVENGVKIRVDVSGTDVFGPAGSSTFDDLDALATALRAGDLTGIRTGIDKLQVGFQRVLGVQTAAGANYARLEKAAQKADDLQMTTTSALAEVENVDLPKAMIEMNLQQVAYQAALSSTAKVMQPSLLDFLR